VKGKKELTKIIKQEASSGGFYDCGISMAEPLAIEADVFKSYLETDYYAEMKWLAANFDKRTNPQNVLKGAKSVISFLYNYYTDKNPQFDNVPKISKYAYGKDYHKVLKKKLEQLVSNISHYTDSFNYKIYVDSGPILEKAWARRAGLGWIGKNSILINPKGGSFFFISDIIIDLELEYDSPIDDHCGKCSLCIESCPTEAISESRTINSNKCISYHTIETEEDIPDDFKGKLDNWVSGCDICQDVCPWNSKSISSPQSIFRPKEEMLKMTRNEWDNLDETTFNNIFKGTTVERGGFDKLKSNIRFIK